MKVLVALFSLALGSSAVASPEFAKEVFMQQHGLMVAGMDQKGLDWKVGDENNYKIDMGFIKGTMQMKVTSVVAEGIWMQQDMDLGFAGKQDVKTLLDPNTGEVKKMIVNGQEQTPPKSNVEIIDMQEARVTVPAGTFDCIHARLKDLDNNQEINLWVNPNEIPLSGMLKTVQPTQIGQATITLTSFRHAN